MTAKAWTFSTCLSLCFFGYLGRGARLSVVPVLQLASCDASLFVFFLLPRNCQLLLPGENQYLCYPAELLNAVAASHFRLVSIFSLRRLILESP